MRKRKKKTKKKQKTNWKVVLTLPYTDNLNANTLQVSKKKSYDHLKYKIRKKAILCSKRTSNINNLKSIFQENVVE